jgi:hypothetical protein
METVGTTRSRDLSRRLTRSARDAGSAPSSLIQISQPDFTFRLGRSQFYQRRPSPLGTVSHGSRKIHEPVVAATTGDRGAIPERNNEELRMSSLSEQDHLNPQDPKYYAPRWLRERTGSPLSPSRETRSEPVRGPISPPAALDIQLESAVSDALWHPLSPDVVPEPSEFEAERDRRQALINVAGRFAAAVGVSAVVALFFVFMIPASRDHALQPGVSSSSWSGMMQSIRAVLYRPTQKDDDSKPALSEFRPILASTSTSPPVMAREQPETLLQKFVQWQQKPTATETSQ